MRFDLPKLENISDNFYETEIDNIVHLWNGNYDITIWRNRTEPIMYNTRYQQDSSKYYRNAKTYNEYDILNLDYTWNGNIFQSLFVLNKEYNKYLDKHRYLNIYGKCKMFTTMQKDNHIFVVILKDNENDSFEVELRIYDKEKEYAYVTKVDIQYNSINGEEMPLDSIKFLVDSLEISDY